MPRIKAPTLRSLRGALPPRRTRIHPRANPSYPINLAALELYLPESYERDADTIFRRFTEIALKARQKANEATFDQGSAAALDLAWLAGAYFELAALRCVRESQDPLTDVIRAGEEMRAEMSTAIKNAVAIDEERVAAGREQIGQFSRSQWDEAMWAYRYIPNTTHVKANKLAWASPEELQRMVVYSVVNHFMWALDDGTLWERFFEPESAPGCELTLRRVRELAIKYVDELQSGRYARTGNPALRDVDDYDPIDAEAVSYLFDDIAPLQRFSVHAPMYDEAARKRLVQILGDR